MNRTIDTKSISIVMASTIVGAIFALVILGSIIFAKKTFNIPINTCIEHREYRITLEGKSLDLNKSCE